MSSAHTHTEEIKNPGSLKPLPKLNLIFLLCIGLGVAAFFAGMTVHKDRVWSSFIVNHFYFLSLGVGGILFAAIQWVTGAMWSVPIRRVMESFTSYLPIGLVMFLILAAFGLHEGYHWSHVDYVMKDPILVKKASYLNTTFFTIRNTFSILVWILLGGALIKNSLAQDKDGDYRFTLKNRVISAIFIILFALTFTMSSFDILMSLDPHWFSTIFGVYCFAGMLYSTLALTCIITLLLKRSGYLLGFVNESHIHDIGKFMFAFVVFWAYIGFSQFMLIWYANLPEETGYFLKRVADPWAGVSIFLVVGKFITPFILLLPRGSKRSEKLLILVAAWMLSAQWIDVMWMVQPEFFKTPSIGWIEIGMTLGFAGIFGLAVIRFLSKHPIVAFRDPKMTESLHHHQ